MQEKWSERLMRNTSFENKNVLRETITIKEQTLRKITNVKVMLKQSWQRITDEWMYEWPYLKYKSI